MSTARYAVFGHPISHSLSPRIHSAFAHQLGIALEYTAIDTAPVDFATALERFAGEGGRGANVTLPLKEAAFALCARTSDRARRAGAQCRVAYRQRRWRRAPRAFPRCRADHAGAGSRAAPGRRPLRR